MTSVCPPHPHPLATYLHDRLGLYAMLVGLPLHRVRRQRPRGSDEPEDRARAPYFLPQRPQSFPHEGTRRRRVVHRFQGFDLRHGPDRVGNDGALAFDDVELDTLDRVRARVGDREGRK